MRTLLISLGAILGANARYWVGVGFTRLPPSGFPWATLTINATGSFLLGTFVAFEASRLAGNPGPRLLVAVGFCGAYTTFSTFSYELFTLLQERSYWLVATYLGASVISGVAGLAAGYAAGNLMGRL